MTKMRGIHPELKKLIRLAEDQDWRVEWTKNGHISLTPPNPSMPQIVSASSPSDWRGVKNMRARMKRAGLRVD